MASQVLKQKGFKVLFGVVVVGLLLIVGLLIIGGEKEGRKPPAENFAGTVTMKIPKAEPAGRPVTKPVPVPQEIKTEKSKSSQPALPVESEKDQAAAELLAAKGTSPEEDSPMAEPVEALETSMVSTSVEDQTVSTGNPPDASPPAATQPQEKEETIGEAAPEPDSTESSIADSQPEPKNNQLPAAEETDTPADQNRAAVVKTFVLSDIYLSENLKGKILEIWANGRISQYRYFILSNPPRLVIDLPGDWEKTKFNEKNLKNDLFAKVRLWRHPDKLRIVCDLISDKAIQPSVLPTPQGVEFLLRTQ